MSDANGLETDDGEDEGLRLVVADMVAAELPNCGHDHESHWLFYPAERHAEVTARVEGREPPAKKRSRS